LGAVAGSNRAKRALGFAFLNLAQAQSAARNPTPKRVVKESPHWVGGEGGFGYCKPKFRIFHRIRSPRLPAQANSGPENVFKAGGGDH